MKTLFLLLALAAILPASGAVSLDQTIIDALAAAGMENRLRPDLQRPIDPRLLKIESEGIEGSGLFKGKVHSVRNAKEVQALSDKLHPGDQLVLTGTDWKDARFVFAGHGTMDAPILIRPEKPGSVVFSGASGVTFYGEHLVIMGLEFRQVVPAKDKAAIFRLGAGRDRPTDNCIVDRIRMENCNSPSPADWPRQKIWYMTAGFGRNNTVANSTFSGLRHKGQMIGAAELPPGQLQGLHILNNHFSDRPFLDGTNGYEIIQIGWSGERARAAGSLIEGNTFENCDGENETITLKASDIFVRNNTFAGCQGVLCLRTARRVLVQGNVFESKGRASTGGVRMQGEGHVIFGNTFRHLEKPRDYYYWPISLMSASVEHYGDHGDVQGYGRTMDVLIAGNRFEGCEDSIAVGLAYSKDYPLLPSNIHVWDNIFVGTTATTPFGFVVSDPTGALPKELHVSGNRFRR